MNMEERVCYECGAPLSEEETVCHECGTQVVAYTSESFSDSGSDLAPSETAQEPPMAPVAQGDGVANYLLNCWKIGWKSFHRGLNFKGRSSRREFWSLVMVTFILSPVTLCLIIFLMFVPLLAAGVRRMHDAGVSGFALLVPLLNIVCLFKGSEDGPNRYGKPVPAITLL